MLFSTRRSLPLHFPFKPAATYTSQSQILHLCSSALPSLAIHRLRSAVTRDCAAVSQPLCYAALLQASTKRFSFPEGLQIQAHVIKSGLEADRFVGNSLLSLYYKVCHDVDSTRKVFDGLPHRDVVAWTSMVSAYVRAGRPHQAISLVQEMWALGVEPNAFTLSAALKSCSEIASSCETSALVLGKSFHAIVIFLGYNSNAVITSALIDMYGSNSSPQDALQMFDEIRSPDAICWTSAISALTRNDEFDAALATFFFARRNHHLVADGFTYGSLLTALGNLRRLLQGKQAHAMIITFGIRNNVVVDSSLVDMYAKCGAMADSQRVFDSMGYKNSVSWCALLGGYCHSGDYHSVLRIFRAMDKEDDNYSLSTVLRACAAIADSRGGKQLHAQFMRTGVKADIIVDSALVDLYCKCGLVDYAHRVFDKISHRNSITWNAMICGFAHNGKTLAAMDLFEKMVSAGVQPGYITFIGVLFACSHGGMVEEGRKQFKRMEKEFRVSPGVEHYNCMVDLLGRAGYLEEAEEMVKGSIFAADVALWAALLGACAKHGDTAVAERVAGEMMRLEPECHLSYVLLANAYKACCRWDDASEILMRMRRRGIRKTAGKSWI